MRCIRCRKEILGDGIKKCPYCNSKLGIFDDVELCIESVEVKKLFNRIDYKIDYKNSQNVSIFIAPNGCGKTTIFNFLLFLLNPTEESYLNIARIPIEKFSCKLSNGIVLTYQKNKEKKDEKFLNFMNFNYSYIIQIGSKKEELNFKEIFENFNKINSKIMPSETGIDLKEYASVMNMETIQNYLYEKGSTILEFYKKVTFRMTMMNRKYNIEPSITFINANRINEISLKKRNFEEKIDERNLGKDITTIDKCLKDSKNLVRTCNIEYSKALDNARRDLAIEYLQSYEEKIPYEIFIQKWNEYLNEIELYQKVGFNSAKNNKDFNIKITKELYETSKGHFLSIYLNQFSKALAPFKELFKKINLFLEIINERNKFTGKRIEFTFEKGITMYVAGEKLDMNCLSSGEKNDFIMFYNLIFASSQNGIVFIDEPEISLHIEWQETFIDKILEICKLNHEQVIIATHSPNIINGHFDLFAKKEADYGI